MKGEHSTQLDNQPSTSSSSSPSSHRVIRGARNRTKNKTSPDIADKSSPSTSRRKISSSENDNDHVITSPSSTSDDPLASSGDSGYSTEPPKHLLTEANLQYQQNIAASSPVHGRRPSVQRSSSHLASPPRHNAVTSKRRRSLPVIFEQEDAARSSPSTSRHRQSRTQLHRRVTSLSDAVIGTSYSYPGVRRNGSTIILDRRGLQKRTSTLADGLVTGHGAVQVIPVAPPSSYNSSEVYSVIPRQSNLPRHGFIIQRNPSSAPHLSRNPYQRRRSITIPVNPHQVRRRPSTISIDEINRQLTRAKLERKDSKVKFSVVEEVSSRRGSLRRGSDGNQSVSQVAESVYSASSCTSSDSDESWSR